MNCYKFFNVLKCNNIHSSFQTDAIFIDFLEDPILILTVGYGQGNEFEFIFIGCQLDM